MQHDPKHVYSKVNSTELKETLPQVCIFRDGAKVLWNYILSHFRIFLLVNATNYNRQ